jgi:hypothetical protein
MFFHNSNSNIKSSKGLIPQSDSSIHSNKRVLSQVQVTRTWTPVFTLETDPNAAHYLALV